MSYAEPPGASPEQSCRWTPARGIGRSKWGTPETPIAKVRPLPEGSPMRNRRWPQSRAELSHARIPGAQGECRESTRIAAPAGRRLNPRRALSPRRTCPVEEQGNPRADHRLICFRSGNSPHGDTYRFRQRTSHLPTSHGSGCIVRSKSRRLASGRSAATATMSFGPGHLDRRARHIAVGAENTAVTRPRTEHGAAALAVIEPLARVGGHRLLLLISALRTPDGREKDRLHRMHSNPWASEGSVVQSAWRSPCCKRPPATAMLHQERDAAARHFKVHSMDDQVPFLQRLRQAARASIADAWTRSCAM